MVEEILAQRGIDVTYETVRCWALTFWSTRRKEHSHLGVSQG